MMLFALPVLLLANCGDAGEGAPASPETAGEPAGGLLPGGAEDEQPQRPALNVPDIQFDGYNFRVLNIDQDSMTWVFTTITAEEETGAEVNDAVFRRNHWVEDRLDITITEIVDSSMGSINGRLSRSVRAGSDDYDLAMLDATYAVRLAQQMMLYDYNAIPHVDLAKPWWDRDMVRDLSYAGHNFIVTGDFSMMHYGNTIAMFFNKQLLNDLQLESPFRIIHEGRWTFDKFSQMARGASRDLNGDGIMDHNDQWGYMSLTHIWTHGFLAAAGQRMVSKDANDLHVFTMGDARFIEVYQRLIDIMHQDDMMFDADVAGDHRLQDIMFPNNQALFWSEVVH